MKPHLDNNVVSAIVRDNTPTESDAIDRLLVASEEGKVEIVTSKLSLTEIRKSADTRRKAIERISACLKRSQS